MRYREILNEMPELIDATDFNLMDAEVNARLAQKLLKAKNPTILEENDRWVLFKVGDREGNIAMYDRQRERIIYWVRFKTIRNKLLGEPVTQIILWRDIKSSFTIGITKHIFFDYFLKEWGMIMSDAQQTPQGRDFWISRMTEANSLGHRVGLIDMTRKTVEWFDTNGLIEDWLESHMNAWGTTNNPIKSNPYQGLRFVISQ